MKLDNLNTKDLRALRDKVDAAIVTKQAEAVETLRAKLKDMAAAHGMTVAEVLGAKSARKTGSARSGNPMVDPKTGVRWAGIGRKPFNFDKARAVPA